MSRAQENLIQFQLTAFSPKMNTNAFSDLPELLCSQHYMNISTSAAELMPPSGKKEQHCAFLSL
ncbi:hypothetical protein INR49_009739 [Caranx melampygus]|nr:hypothetical protein INR49_009739 [Caranx melampygus]